MYKSYSNSQPKLYNNDLPGLLIQTNHKNDILHDWSYGIYLCNQYITANGHCVRDCMVIWLTTYAISVDHHWSFEFNYLIWRGVLDNTHPQNLSTPRC
jgi:hypothetical protein